MSSRKNPAAAPSGQDFDRALEEVEKIIERIESGRVGLEQSIAEYERGAILLRRCRERLLNAEQKVKDLTAQLRAETGSPPAPPTDGGDDVGDGPDDGGKDAPF